MSPIYENSVETVEDLVHRILSGCVAVQKTPGMLWEGVAKHGASLQCLKWCRWPPLRRPLVRRFRYTGDVSAHMFTITNFLPPLHRDIIAESLSTQFGFTPDAVSVERLTGSLRLSDFLGNSFQWWSNPCLSENGQVVEMNCLVLVLPMSALCLWPYLHRQHDVVTWYMNGRTITSLFWYRVYA